MIRLKINFNYYYVRMKERKICVTKKEFNTGKCRKDVYPSKYSAGKNLTKQLEQGYEKVSAKEFGKLLV